MMKRAQLAKRAPIATEILTDANGVVFEEVIDAEVTTTTTFTTKTIVETTTIDVEGALVEADYPFLAYLSKKKVTLPPELRDVLKNMSPFASEIAVIESAPEAVAQALQALH